MKRKSRYIGLIMFTMLLLCGCSNITTGKISHPYTFAERNYLFDTSQNIPLKAQPFAYDLCIVTDELQYDGSQVSSEAGALFHLNDKTVIYSKNVFEKLYPASTTKVMTALVAIKNGNLSDMVTVPPEAVITEAGATLCGIKPGDTLTLEQLLYGLLLPSGNDAAVAVAVHTAGSVENFNELMNLEAKKLGATGSHFSNPHGLSDDNLYTTAYDLYLIFNEAFQCQEFRKIIHAPSYTAEYKDREGNEVSQTWNSSNKYINGDESTPEGLQVVGGKTGTTSAAGYCLILGSQNETGDEYISVILKAGTRPDLYKNMTGLLQKIEK